MQPVILLKSPAPPSSDYGVASRQGVIFQMMPLLNGA
jgi:hypothetical protein